MSVKRRLFAKFALGTLFYIFYTFPRDILQVLASQELYNRHWKFHIESKVWFLPQSQNQAQSSASGSASATGTSGPGSSSVGGSTVGGVSDLLSHNSESTAKPHSSIDVNYIYFDPKVWKKKYYPGKLQGKEEDIFLSKDKISNLLFNQGTT